MEAAFALFGKHDKKDDYFGVPSVRRVPQVFIALI